MNSKAKSVRMAALLLLLFSLATSWSCAQQASSVAPAATSVVAAEMISQHLSPSYFTPGPTYTYPNGEVPFTKVPEGTPERTFTFGDPVDINFQGLNPKATYAIELVFLSNTEDRAFSVFAGTDVLEQKILTPFGKTVYPRYLIPPRDYANGRLAIHINKVTGLAVVISGFTLYSTDPKLVRAVPAPPLPPPTVPRYTPRPSSVTGAGTLRVDLNGTWQFNPTPPNSFWLHAQDAAAWKTVQVPGEWTMQGFAVDAQTPAAYVRSFAVPPAWRGLNVKLKCDAAFSDATVWVNGQQTGRHIGAFTPFEFDVTKFVRPGRANTIALAVKADSVANTIDSAMSYAGRNLGGITRKIYLFAVPKTNLSDVYLTTKFDAQFRNATLHAAVQVANDTGSKSAGRRLSFALRDASGQQVPLTPSSVAVPAIAANGTTTIVRSFAVAAPKQWDPDHPNLYSFICTLSAGSRIEETVPCRLGFRQVEVRGNQLFVNGHSVKLRGTARHEIDPVRGRTLLPGAWRRDVQILRDANINNVRTTHYPPAEEFVQASSEVGMFVEEEAPICWASPTDPHQAGPITEAQAETVMRDRSEPSVIIWSLGNEMNWGPNFDKDLAFNKLLDSSRVYDFEGGTSEPIGMQVPANIAPRLGPLTVRAGSDPLVLPMPTPHYPAMDAPALFAASPFPIHIGEYGHLTDYDRTELYTDPGLRDVWAEGFSKMWESMEQSRGTVGGNVWAAIDEVVFEPNGSADGCGPWGLIDGWRRPKPEYFYVKKIYSPLRVTADTLPLSNGSDYRFHVENRLDFSNLSELRFHWSVGSRSGWAKSSAAPHHVGTLNIPHGTGNGQAAALHLDIFSPRGFVVDSYDFPLGTPATAGPARASGPMTLVKGADTITIRGAGFGWDVDARNGQILSGKDGTATVLTGGPHLMLIPRQPGGGFTILSGPEPVYTPANPQCTGWKAASVTAEQTGGSVTVTVAGSYDQAKGSYTMLFDGAGGMKASYSFNPTAPINVWEMGLAFDVPRSLDTLSWTRQTAWSGYPADHIGRPVGTARASSAYPIVGPFGPHVNPGWAWSQDNSPMGSNDFRSSKWHVLNASLTDASGVGVQMVSDGSQNARAWLEGDQIKLFAIDFANQGSAGFVVERIYPDRMLTPGTNVVGHAALQLREDASSRHAQR